MLPSQQRNISIVARNKMTYSKKGYMQFYSIFYLIHFEQTTQDKINEQNLQKWLVETEGTKIGNLLFYLKRLWTDNPSAKILVFSKVGGVTSREHGNLNF